MTPILHSLKNLIINNLTTLSLHSNRFAGAIPPELGQLQNLRYLYIYSNQLRDSIPAALGQLNKLQHLYLHYNQLSGTIPPQLGNLTELTYLYLNNNALRGEVPATFGQLTKLRSLYLELNQLYSTLPAELGQLSLLVNLNVSVNNFEGYIPPELGQLTNLATLNLSINQLSGNIPPELGNLVNLTQLTLELNNLQGDIPKALNKLAKLESLKLSLNQLTGFLADSLEWLTNLTNISVYYNNLTFEDLEEKTGLFDKYFYYTPQYKIGQGLLVSLDTGVSYTLVSGDSNDDNNSFFIAANQLHTNTIFNYDLKNTFLIRVQTEDKYQSVFSKSFAIIINEVVVNDIFLIPDAFSPNGDGKNDYFVIPGLEKFPKADMKIYNRYGKLVYHQQMAEANINDMSNIWWNGRLKANGQSGIEILPQGFYFLVLKTDENTSHKKTIYLKE